MRFGWDDCDCGRSGFYTIFALDNKLETILTPSAEIGGERYQS